MVVGFLPPRKGQPLNGGQNGWPQSVLYSVAPLYFLVLYYCAVPLMPTGFSIVEEFYSNSNLTVLFQWDEPQGEGVQAIVDNYTIDISPRPLYPSEYSIVLPNSPQSLNVTINYNTNYIATITAENCAGPSQPFNYPNIGEYGNECKRI